MKEEEKKLVAKALREIEKRIAIELLKCFRERKMEEFWAGIACLRDLLELEKELTT